MRDLSDLICSTVPSGAIQRHMLTETEERRDVVGPAPVLPDDAGTSTTLRTALGQTVAELAPQVVGLSHDVHDHPETGYEEHHAVATVVELLRRHGIEPEVGIYGIDTALHTEIPGGGGADTVAGGSCESAGTVTILAEYNALPGIDRGCGYNVTYANSVGAFLVLATLTRTRPGSLPGHVVLQTTPAEESSTVKEVLAVYGMPNGVNAAIQTHSYAHDATHQTWLGVRRLRVIFHSVPAHAASQPFMGHNALDAVTLALTDIGLLHQQMLPMDRLHTVIIDSGRVPNIIPERAGLSIMVCSKYLGTPKEITEWAEEILHDVTLVTGTGVGILTSEYCNETLVRDSGPLLTSRVCSQRERGCDPLAAGVLPETITVGTDFGNMSQRTPGIHPLIKVVDQPGVALHTLAITEAVGAPTGDVAALDGVYGLVVIALDWLYDVELHRVVHTDFEATGGAIDVADFWEE